MASNVIIEKTYNERFFQHDLKLEIKLSSEALENHQIPSKHFTELIPYLYYYFNECPIDNITKITNILLRRIKKEFRKVYTLEFKDNFVVIKNDNGDSYIYKNNYLEEEDYLEFMRKIRHLIISCDDLNIREKGELCRLERYFMKKYLEKINFK
ncbi:MAG: hypothetical protein KGD63_08340 [Candidatus Lokiarchaeota archaeon]|nr:hypothetical protein [Candidatus Lokiarchaeota archaeon]